MTNALQKVGNAHNGHFDLNQFYPRHDGNDGRSSHLLASLIPTAVNDDGMLPHLF